MRVFVYWNLRKQLWSVKSLEGDTRGKVVSHMSEVLLKDASGKVSEAGRQRVLREKRKNVHAGLVGTFIPLREAKIDPDIIQWIGDRITYNPYLYKEFVHVVDESKFEGSPYALLTYDRVVFVA